MKMDVNVAADRRQIDTILYMASLASEPRAIDPILDEVRAVTANMSPGVALTPKQRQSLKAAESQLERYLTETEPVRDFTDASLRDRIEARFAGGLSPNFLRWMLALTLAVTCAIGAVLLLLPLDLAPKVRFQMVGSTVFGLLPAGAAVFFYTALRTFKPELRRAYKRMCLGMLIFGATMLDQPVLDYYHVRESPFGAFAIAAPMLIAFVLVYAGVQQYVTVVGLRGWLHRKGTLVQALALGSVIAVVLPHTAISHFPEAFFDLSAVLLVSLGVLAIMTGLQLFGIAKTGAQLYAGAQRTLGIALVLAGSGALYILLLRYLLGMARPDGPYALSVLAFIVAGSLFLRAGYAFNRAGRY